MKKLNQKPKFNALGSLSTISLSANGTKIRDRDLITTNCLDLFLNSEKAHSNRDRSFKSIR